MENELKPCPTCNGRGYFATDMMGSGFYACDDCRTHETRYNMFGPYVVLRPSKTDLDLAAACMNDLHTMDRIRYGADMRDTIAEHFAALLADQTAALAEQENTDAT